MTDPFPPHWRVVGGSVPGSRHVAAAQANQDSWLYRQVAADGFVLAVADGAGSRPRSAVGSRLAVEAAFASACAVWPDRPLDRAQDWAEVAGRWAGACRATFLRSLDGVAEALSDGRAGGAPGRDEFATTLLAVLTSPPWYSYISIGDCFAVVHRRPGGAYLVVPPAMAGSRDVTTFLTAPEAATEMSSGVIDEPHLSGLAVCSDGLTEATLDTARDAGGAIRYIAPPAFTGFFEVFADPDRTAADLAAGFISPEYGGSSGDDMTMVLAVRE
jgi:serine/threonine protein phosphatase PrpC